MAEFIQGVRNSPIEKDKDIAPDSPLRKLIKIFRTNTALKFHSQSGGTLKPLGTAKAFFKNSFNLNSLVPTVSIFDRFSRYCLTGDTLIATNNEQGYLRLDEVVEKFNKGEEVVVFAYDKEKKTTVAAKISNAWATKIDEIWEVELDNGVVIRATKEHPFMLRDGSYCEVKDLVAGMALMPFSRGTISTPYRNKTSNYRVIYSVGKGKRGEHVLVGEMMQGGAVNGQTHHVHHKDFNGLNNLTENLVVMTVEDHRKLHNHLNKIKWGRPGAHEEMSEFAKARWAPGGDLRENLKEMRKKIESSKFHKENFLDQKGFNNFNAKKDITFQVICNNYKKGIKFSEFYKNLDTTAAVIAKRLEWAGYKNWSDFTSKYENHKVVAVRKTNIQEQVYDLTVPGLHNFAVCGYVGQSVKGCVYVSNSDYADMMASPIIAKALDIYADESTQKDEDGKTIKVISEDKEIKEIITELFDDILHLNGKEIYKLVRYLCKYGDVFYLIDATEEQGVMGLIIVPANEIEREEGFDKEEPTAVRFRWATRSNMEIPNAYMAHFRLDGEDQFLPFGQSVLEAARRPHRQLSLMEDHMLAYRVIRTPERRVYYLDMMGVPPENEDEVVNKFNNTLKKNKIVDTDGNLDLRFGAAQTVEEDLIVAVRGNDSGTRIETLPGGQNTTDIADIEYIRKNLFAALGVPKAFLTFDEGTGSKQTLSMEDIRFARSIARIQEAVIHELLKICLIHLYIKGYRGKELFNFKLKMTNPSTIAELQKNELWRARMDLVQAAGDGVFDTNFIYKNFLHLTDEAINLIRQGQIQDKMFQSKLLTIESQGGMANPGMGGGMGGGMMGGGVGGGMMGGGMGGGLGGFGGDPGGMPGGAGLASNMGSEGGAPANVSGLPPVPESLNPAAKIYGPGGKDLSRRSANERVATKREMDDTGADVFTAEEVADFTNDAVDMDGVRRTISSPLGMEESRKQSVTEASLQESLKNFRLLSEQYKRAGCGTMLEDLSAHYSFLRPTVASARECVSITEHWLREQFGEDAGLVRELKGILKESLSGRQPQEDPMQQMQESWDKKLEEIDVLFEDV